MSTQSLYVLLPPNHLSAHSFIFHLSASPLVVPTRVDFPSAFGQEQNEKNISFYASSTTGKARRTKPVSPPLLCGFMGLIHLLATPSLPPSSSPCMAQPRTKPDQRAPQDHQRADGRRPSSRILPEAGRAVNEGQLSSRPSRRIWRQRRRKHRKRWWLSQRCRG